MQNREELRLKERTRSQNATHCEREKKSFSEGGGEINIIFGIKSGPPGKFKNPIICKSSKKNIYIIFSTFKNKARICS
jgi:hypothetical protein